jgi:hypothetical protein
VWKFILKRLIEAVVAVSVIIAVVLIAASIHPNRANPGLLPYVRVPNPCQQGVIGYVGRRKDIRMGLFVHVNGEKFYCSGKR